MRQRFILFRRGDVFYCEDTTTKKQESLRTKSKAEALSLLNAKNESFRQPSLNLHIARTYLAAVDSEIAKRPWRAVMEEIAKLKKGVTGERYLQAMPDDRSSAGARAGDRHHKCLPPPHPQFCGGYELAALAASSAKTLA